MARLPRLNLPGFAQHIIQRGNNRQICFSCEEDFSNYLTWLAEYSVKFGMGQSGFRLTPHDEYLRLGRSGAERRETYRSLFTGHVDGSMIKDIRDAVNKGLALGSDRFKDEIETNLKRRVRPAKKGRPRNQTVNTQKQKSLL